MTRPRRSSPGLPEAPPGEEIVKGEAPSEASGAAGRSEDTRLGEIMEVLVALATKDFTKRASLGDGTHVLDGIAGGLNMLAEEVGRQHRAEQDFRRRIAHSDRLAAVGQLAASVAHEINNPAAFVLANLTAMEDRLSTIETLLGEIRTSFPKGSPQDRRVAELLARSGADAAVSEARQGLVDSVSGVQRIVSIVKDLRSFTRIDAGRAEPVSLLDVVEDACKLVAHEVVYRAELVKRFQPTPKVMADRIKLTQVITNLLLNAAQAIPEGAREENRVEISTGSKDHRVFIRIRDTGAGIPREVQARLFEPFFTTKSGDRGMGLGLAVSSEIVRRHRGELRFESAPGQGATFEIWLPADAAHMRPSAAPASPLQPIPAVRPRVLIVDDEDELLTAYKRLLAKQLDLTLAPGGRAAVSILESDTDWDAILCDIMMPDMDGTAVYEWVASHTPHLLDRLGFCTGGVFTPRSRALAERVAGRLFDKPLSRTQVMSAVEQLRPK